MSYLIGNPSVASVGNATTTPLAASATFTGTTELNPSNDVFVQVLTDQPGTLFMEFSLDGTNWDSSLSFSVTANVPLFRHLVKGARQFRVRFTNTGSSPQTFIRLGAFYGLVAAPNTPRNLAITNDSSAMVVRPIDGRLDRARGGYATESSVRKFGFNGSIGTATEVVAATSSVTFPWLSTATTVRIKAGGDANDDAAGTGVRTVRVEGLDSSFLPATADLTTAGASASAASVQTFIRIFRAYGLTTGTYHGANADDIVLENGAGGTDLVTIVAERGKSQIGAYTVPANKTAYLTSWRAIVEGSKQANVRLMQYQNADTVAAPFDCQRLISQFGGLQGFAVEEFESYEVIPEKTDIWLEAEALSGTAIVSGEFSLLLVDA